MLLTYIHSLSAARLGCLIQKSNLLWCSYRDAVSIFFTVSQYHCLHLSRSPAPPPPHPASSSLSIILLLVEVLRSNKMPKRHQKRKKPLLRKFTPWRVSLCARCVSQQCINIKRFIWRGNSRLSISTNPVLVPSCPPTTTLGLLVSGPKPHFFSKACPITKVLSCPSYRPSQNTCMSPLWTGNIPALELRLHHQTQILWELRSSLSHLHKPSI